ncbi:hypothetical protein [Paraflavitalea sp. CAU 1676]|uniref:hypothetical protein n=1 Tax=Paraflavitalea sp. CAU 1676 TaxID=3032598 RepID=UPI0023DBF7C0|nr:hypothetical protein [Paraflavitalea sp. CAU 1676]MDF2189848.1 hypothetical protein [Paraflavitalea sp. CAU 1676]
MSAKLTILIFLFCCIEARADAPQRLLVPRIEKPIMAKNGVIELPAYCSDISRIWPETGSIIKKIYWGAKETKIKLIVNGKTKDISLDAAMFIYHLVKLMAEARSISIHPTSTGVKLVRLQSEGFLVGMTSELPPLTREEYTQMMPGLTMYDKNEHITYYLGYQQNWWRAIHESGKQDAMSTIREIAEQTFKNKKGLELTFGGPGMIKLYDKGNNLKLVSDFYSTESLMLYNLKRLGVEDYDDLQVCLNFDPADSSLLSFTISGKYRNIVPFEIENSSSSEILVTTSIQKEVDLVPGISIESSVAIEVDSKKNKADINYPLKKCELKFSGSICTPGSISIDAEVCGIKVSLKPSAFRFNEY